MENPAPPPAPAPDVDADLGDLLDFEPVPRKTYRVDGWHADAQRAFVHALSITGSHRRAAAAVGKAKFGVDQLLRAPGSEGFRAACDAAMAIAATRSARRIASGLEAIEAQAAAWTPAAAPWNRARSRPAPPPPPEPDDKAKGEWLDVIIGKYLIKLQGERDARTAGRIVEADFFLRQLTYLEVLLDVTTDDGFGALRDFRMGEHRLVDIAETPMSRLLGDARRARWDELGDPPRPDHPPRARLVDHGRYGTEPLEHTRGGQALDHDAQRQAFRDRHARDAEAQLEWEAEARRDYERRRASAADS